MNLRRLADRTPLRVKIVATVVLLTIVGLAAAGFAATSALQDYLLARVDSQLATVAHPIADRGELPFDVRGGGGRSGLPSAYYLRVLDASGRPVLSTGAPLMNGATPPRLPQLTTAQASQRKDQPFTVPAQGGGAKWRVLAVVLPDGSGSVLVAQSVADVQGTVARLRFLELAIGAAVVLLLAGAGYLLVQRSLRPLAAVEETAAAIAAGDLSRRVPQHHPRTEVGQLALAFNGMLGQIEQAFARQAASEAEARRSEQRMRRFVTDASHELRTPLTSIRGFAELYRQGAVAEPAAVGRAMRRIEDEANRMGLLVEDLLLLARLDQQRPLERQPVDLLTLAADAVHDAQAIDPDRPVRLEFGPGDTAPVVVGDEPRLRQVLGNLVSNALHHTPAGTPVSVRVGAEAAGGGSTGYAVLEVADTGPGLAPEEADRVFERFYRADSSRSRRNGGGSGLGLSIVAAVTAAHGGRVEVQTAPGEGARFRVLLPLDGQPAVPAGS